MKLAGIIFFRTTMLRDIVDFYVNEAGMHIWLEQAECVILNHGNLLLGFCERDDSETENSKDETETKDSGDEIPETGNNEEEKRTQRVKIYKSCILIHQNMGLS